MGIQRVECIVSACMLKAATPVGAQKSNGERFCPDAFWSANFKQEMR